MVNITYVPYFRKERRTIVIKVYMQGKTVKVINTSIRIEPRQWDEDARKIINHPNSRLLNQKIKNKLHELEADFIKAELLGVELTPTKVKKIAEGTKVTTDFYKHCEAWVKEKYTNKGTLTQALTELRKLKAFAPALSFGDIDSKFLTRYMNYMKTDLGNKGNTPWKSLKFVRTMLYDAKELAASNPFQNKEFKMPRYEATHKDGLYISEVDQLEEIFNEDVPVMYKIITAKFLFMCYTGLRISDAQRFNYKQHIEMNERIVMQTQKEGTWINLFINERLQRLFTIMKELPEKKLSDQKLNDWLKVIAEHKSITRVVLTNHVGRHTCGCMLAESGVPMEAAQRILGHKNINSTKIYYKLRQYKIDEAMKVAGKLKKARSRNIRPKKPTV